MKEEVHIPDLEEEAMYRRLDRTGPSPTPGFRARREGGEVYKIGDGFLPFEDINHPVGTPPTSPCSRWGFSSPSSSSPPSTVLSFCGNTSWSAVETRAPNAPLLPPPDVSMRQLSSPGALRDASPHHHHALSPANLTCHPNKQEHCFCNSRSFPSNSNSNTRSKSGLHSTVGRLNPIA
jgi:hypothetical protein